MITAGDFHPGAIPHEDRPQFEFSLETRIGAPLGPHDVIEFGFNGEFIFLIGGNVPGALYGGMPFVDDRETPGAGRQGGNGLKDDKCFSCSGSNKIIADWTEGNGSEGSCTPPSRRF
jgi:hypothetical protein